MKNIEEKERGSREGGKDQLNNVNESLKAAPSERLLLNLLNSSSPP